MLSDIYKHINDSYLQLQYIGVNFNFNIMYIVIPPEQQIQIKVSQFTLYCQDTWYLKFLHTE